MKEIVLLKSRLDKQGGAEKYTWRLSDAFLRQNCRVTLLTSGTLPPQKNTPHLTIHSLTKKRMLSVSNVHAFDAFCQKHLSQANKSHPIFGLDHNSFQTHLRASNGVHAAYLNHRKRVDSTLKSLSFHLNPLHRTLLAIEKTSFTHPALKCLIVNSHLVKKEVLEYYDVNPKKIDVVHNGVEWNEKEAPFASWLSSKEQQCKTLHLSKDTFHFLFLGHNFHRKGLTFLLKGLSLLRDESVHLSIVGKDKNEGAFRHLAKQLKLDKHVHFWGPCQDPTPFFQLADALVIPSTYDPFANVTVEALAMGVYVVSSKTNGGHEVLTQESGCTIDSLTDPDSVASALKKALNHKKNKESAATIRNSIQHLDFSKQLLQITQRVLT